VYSATGHIAWVRLRSRMTEVNVPPHNKRFTGIPRWVYSVGLMGAKTEVPA
jgi:hypothetical protein